MDADGRRDVEGNMVAFTFANHFTSSRFAIPGIVHYHQWMALLCGDCFWKGEEEWEERKDTPFQEKHKWNGNAKLGRVMHNDRLLSIFMYVLTTITGTFNTTAATATAIAVAVARAAAHHTSFWCCTTHLFLFSFSLAHFLILLLLLSCAAILIISWCLSMFPAACLSLSFFHMFMLRPSLRYTYDSIRLFSFS